MTKSFVFELGDKVKDALSPYKGVVLARTQYMTGCNTYGIFDGKLDKDGKPHEWKWFDESQLVKLPGRFDIEAEAPREDPRKGGPCNPSAPSR